MQKTKMVFTIGPASDNEEVLTQLIKIGMDACRLNFSHGTHETHEELINKIKKLRESLKSQVAILMDIKGPKIRTHNFKNDSAELKVGSNFTIVCGEGEILGDETKCSVSYSQLYKDVSVGGSLLIDDGLLELKINAIEGSNISYVL